MTNDLVNFASFFTGYFTVDLTMNPGYLINSHLLKKWSTVVDSYQPVIVLIYTTQVDKLKN